MKIYTKTGDNGTTGLFAGPRVPKDHPRISAYGAVDELNAVLGLVVSEAGVWSQQAPHIDGLGIEQMLVSIQGDLFAIGAELATPDPEAHGTCLLTDQRVHFLETCIDTYDRHLAPLQQFILPGGCHDSAQLHFARTVCRRAERDVVQLANEAETHDCTRIIVYLNRLSDLLFVLARLANQLSGAADTPWVNAPGS